MFNSNFTKMKKQILSFLFVLSAALLISTSAFAQPSTPASDTPVTAVDGSTVTYSVTALAGATYHWILSGGSNTNDLPSQPAGALNDNSVSITWDNATPATVYTLDVYVVDALGCYSEMKRTSITIQTQTIDLVAAQTATICSWLTTSAITGNTPAYDQVLLNFATNGGISPVDITYTITCAALSVAETVTVNNVNLLTATTGTLAVDITNKFANTTSSSQIFTIEITSATDNAGNTMTTPGNVTAAITVRPIPVISFN